MIYIILLISITSSILCRIPADNTNVISQSTKQVLKNCHKKLESKTVLDYHWAMRGCMICELSQISGTSVSKNKAHLSDYSRTAVNFTTSLNKTTDVIAAFNNVYAKEKWGKEGGGSGTGSNDIGGRDIRRWINRFIFTYRIKTYIDAPCGAVHSSWTKSLIQNVRSNIECFKYYGFDAAEEVIMKNSHYFINDSNIKFQHIDLSSSHTMLPSNADMIFCRDALQHVSYPTIAGILSTFCRCNATFLMVGSYLETGNNKNIDNGADAFSINLLEAPFSFDVPLDIFKDYHNDGLNPKYILLYRLQHLCASKSLNTFVTNYSKTKISV